MPGALFDRQVSIEPSPEPDWEKVRVVRFAPGMKSPQGASDRRYLDSPAHTSTRTSISRGPESISSSESARESSPERTESSTTSPRKSQRGLSSSAKTLRSGQKPLREPAYVSGTQSRFEDHFAYVSGRSKGKEKERQPQSDGESSFATKMKGKERELSDVRQAVRTRAAHRYFYG